MVASGLSVRPGDAFLLWQYYFLMTNFNLIFGVTRYGIETFHVTDSYFVF
jgi:hypothetical protein